MKKKYIIELTEKQLRILNRACNMYSRLIEGQDFAYQELFEAAWEKNCEKETGEKINESWDGGWYNMRDDAEELSNKIKKRFWGLNAGANYGVKYDEESDMLYDMHQVMRHQLYLDNPNPDKPKYIVDADEPISFGTEPLIKIKAMEE